jgi:carboxyl-terminal processing protease
MKKICVLALLLSFALKAQNHDKACDIFSKVNILLQEKHYKPKPVDDSLSVYVFETVMESLDDNKTLFLQQEYDQLALHRLKIDDYITNKDCSFFTDFLAVYKKALERNKAFVQEIAGQPLPYYTKDTIHYSKKTFPYNNDPARIKNYLRKKITFDILSDVAKLSKNKDSLKLHLEALGKTSREKIIEGYLCRLDGMLAPSEGFDNTLYNLFFSTFCSYFDPHSTYFNYNEKASFVSSISTENYSLGLYVSQNDNEEIIVEEVVPGGPAYRTEKVDKGDQILKLAANGTEYAVSCTSMETISDIVFSDNYKEVQLTLRKKDGTIYSVNLEKKIMKADDHSAYSFILGEKNPVGYIRLPSFYTAFDTDSKQGCADDVAKEIAKLKKDTINGLIIDLQFNGGGSMDEVIRMAGMFINFGPLAVITDKGKAYNVVKDYNRGMLYDGPVVVLVNGFSASASEFFAGVMQDYNRALIVGNTTVGKATMQTILPLEEKDGEPKDFVKVTVDKFYRVTGKSSQYTGIIPDVPLPSFFDDLLPRESSSPTALKNDSLQNYSTRFTPLPDTENKRAIALSKTRTEANTDFALISAVNKKINAVYDANKEPLAVTFDAVFADVHAMDGIWKNISDASEKQQDFKITNTTYTAEMLTYDEYLKNANEYKMKAAKNDIYINEAIQILTDLNRLNNQ